MRFKSISKEDNIFLVANFSEEISNVSCGSVMTTRVLARMNLILISSKLVGKWSKRTL